MGAVYAVNVVKPYAEYHTTGAVEDRVLTTSQQFEIKKKEVALSDWEDFRKFGKAIGDDEFAFLRLSGLGKGIDENGKSVGGTGDADSAEERFGEGNSALQRRSAGPAQRWVE